MEYTIVDHKLKYIDHNGEQHEVRGCRLTVDKFDRHWIWSEQLNYNLVYKTKGRENALLAAINSLLFTIQLRDERIKSLQRITDLTDRFVNEVKPDNEDY